MLPPGLSMLWEPTDPARALQERFGFDGLEAAAGWVSRLLDEAWGLTVRGCRRLVISGPNAIVWADTPQGGLVVKWSRAEGRFAALAASARVLGHLGRRGLPVAAPVPALDRRERVVVEGPVGPLSVAVQPELGGDWLDVTDEAAVRSAGATLAVLQRELRDCSDDRLPTTSRITVSREAIERWAAEEDRGLAPEASSRLRGLLAGLPELDDAPQLVHDDYRAANLLTSASAVVAVLDFDELALGQPVGELAYASVYLATRFTGWRPTPPEVRRRLRAGYESVRTLTPVEDRWYEVLVLWLSIQAVPGPEDPGGWAAAVP